jgi:hypothetical protein
MTLKGGETMKRLLFALILVLVLGTILTGCDKDNVNVPKEAVTVEPTETFNVVNETWDIIYNLDPNTKPDRVMSNERTWDAGGLTYVEGSLKVKGKTFDWKARWVGQSLTYLKIHDQVVKYDEDVENTAMDDYNKSN